MVNKSTSIGEYSWKTPEGGSGIRVATMNCTGCQDVRDESLPEEGLGRLEGEGRSALDEDLRQVLFVFVRGTLDAGGRSQVNLAIQTAQVHNILTHPARNTRQDRWWTYVVYVLDGCRKE